MTALRPLLPLVVLVALTARVDAAAFPETGATARELVPEGFTAFATAEGDLDGDGDADLALAVFEPRGVEPMEDERPRTLLVALRDSAGLLRRVAVAEGALLCPACGGVFGDPFSGLAIDRGAVVVTHYGGSAWRWGYVHRFRLQDGAWTLIGETASQQQTTTELSSERDHNLMTGLVREKARPEEGGKFTRRAYFVLRAGPASKAPDVNGVIADTEWPTRGVALETSDDVVAGRAGRSGPEDASVVLRALTFGDALYLLADVKDDKVLDGDTLRLVDDRGTVLVPPVVRRQAHARGGYVLEARIPLPDLHLTAPPDEGRRRASLSVELVDVDAAGEKDPTVLSTSRGGRRYSAAIELVPRLGLPTLETFELVP